MALKTLSKLSPAISHLPTGDIEKTTQFFSEKLGVENIESLFSELKESGTIFRYELTKQPWGMHEMQINDPYLNAIRFREEIK